MELIWRKIHLAQWIWILIALILIISSGADFFSNPNPESDWMMYIRASRIYLSGGNIYHAWIRQLLYSNMYLYSPFFTCLLIPVSWLPIILSLMLWHVVKIILLYRVFTITSKFSGYQSLSEKQKAVALATTFLFSIRFLLYDFNLGQTTVFLLWGMVEGWYQLSKQKIFLGSFLIALGFFVKMLSIIFIPYLIYKKKFKAVLYLFLWIIIMVLIPFVTGRWDYNFRLLTEWIEILYPMASVNGDYNSSSTTLHDLFHAVPSWYQTFNVLIDRFFEIPDLNNQQLRIIIYVLIFLAVVGFLFISISGRDKKVSREKIEFAEIIYLIGCIPVIFPYQQKYSYVLQIPLMIFWCCRLVAGKLTRTDLLLIAFAFILMVVSTDGIIGRSLNMITQELKFITIGGMILLTLFVYKARKSLSE